MELIIKPYLLIMWRSCFYLLLFVLSVEFYSCSNDSDANFINTALNITIPREGGSERIVMNTSEYDIVKIVNLDDGKDIKGNIIVGNDKDNPQMVYKDTTLTLPYTQFGTLEAKGFTLDKYVGKTFELTVDANYKMQPFRFAIILKSGKTTKNITVTQEASNHSYSFKSIAYSIEKGDGASNPYWYDDTSDVYTKDMGTGGSVTVAWTFSPSYYIADKDQISKFCVAAFSSDDDGAFEWLLDVAPDVTVPLSLFGGEINYYNKKVEYDSTNRGLIAEYPLPSEMTVLLKAGVNKLHFKFEMIKTVITYTLIITDKQNGVDRQFKGKWTLVQPTGNYELINIVNQQ